MTVLALLLLRSPSTFTYRGRDNQGSSMPFTADLILKGGRTIGHATHPGYSFYFRKMLALSFIDIEHAAPGTRVKVLWGNPDEPQTELHATVKPAPYKQDNRRIDLTSGT